MPTDKQANYIRYLLSKKGYCSDDWGWLHAYGKKQAGKLIDKLLNDQEGSVEFIMTLPPPVKRHRQAFLPLPEPEPLPLDPAAVPDERTRFKRWAKEIFQRGEQTISQLGELYDSRFGNPFAICRLPVKLPIELP